MRNNLHMTVDGLIKASRRRQIAKIHILKKQLGMKDADYHQLLEITTGKRSSADMTTPERIEVIEQLQLREREANQGASPLHVP